MAMDKKTKMIIGGVILVVVLVVTFIILKKKGILGGKKTSEPSGGREVGGTAPGTTPIGMTGRPIAPGTTSSGQTCPKDFLNDKGLKWVWDYKERLEKVMKTKGLKGYDEAHQYLKDQKMGAEQGAYDWFVAIKKGMDAGLYDSWECAFQANYEHMKGNK